MDMEAAPRLLELLPGETIETFLAAARAGHARPSLFAAGLQHGVEPEQNGEATVRDIYWQHGGGTTDERAAREQQVVHFMEGSDVLAFEGYTAGLTQITGGIDTTARDVQELNDWLGLPQKQADQQPLPELMRIEDYSNVFAACCGMDAVVRVDVGPEHDLGL